MPITAIVGANWGDEGKGKITDYLAAEADSVVRFQGGRNAGHTVINEFGKFALHLLPSGVFREKVANVLGPGVALDPAALKKELDELVGRGVPFPRVLVSDRAQVVLPVHVLADQYEEERLGAAGYGSTKSGIAPFYSDKYRKIGIQVGDLISGDRVRSRAERNLAFNNVLFRHLYGKPEYAVETLMDDLNRFADILRPFTVDSTEFIQSALREGRRILLEGQLGALRDPDHGIYPFSTSSSPLAGFASVGAGIPAAGIQRVVAVTKAYSSCVGAAPFVTELPGDDGDELRERGGDAGEYGATTGRPRRVGWFDAVATRYGCRLQGATEIALTNLDVLGYLDEIPVCVAYEIDGKRTDGFPGTGDLERARPVFKVLPGWKRPLGMVRRIEDLPSEAQEYVGFIEREIHVPVTWISVGPERQATIRRRADLVGSLSRNHSSD